jgi:hypothetical protein
MRQQILMALGVAAAVGCAGKSVDPTEKFVGTWKYAAGSTIEIDCAGQPARTIDLAHVMGGQPGFFTFTASAGGVHEVDARQCAYDWTIASDVATAAPNQSCSTFPDGQGGNLLVHLTSGTKTTTDGASIAVDVHFTTEAPSSCAIHTLGTATK